MKRLLVILLLFITTNVYAQNLRITNEGQHPLRHRASRIRLDDTAGNYDSMDVEGALDEIGAGTVGSDYFLAIDGTNANQAIDVQGHLVTAGTLTVTNTVTAEQLTSTDDAYITDKIGIGTTAITESVNIANRGAIKMSTDTDSHMIKFYDGATETAFINAAFAGTGTTGNDLIFGSDLSPTSLSIERGGNVGIGTTAASYKLHNTGTLYNLGMSYFMDTAYFYGSLYATYAAYFWDSISLPDNKVICFGTSCDTQLWWTETGTDGLYIDPNVNSNGGALIINGSIRQDEISNTTDNAFWMSITRTASTGFNIGHYCDMTLSPSSATDNTYINGAGLYVLSWKTSQNITHVDGFTPLRAIANLNQTASGNITGLDLVHARMNGGASFTGTLASGRGFRLKNNGMANINITDWYSFYGDAVATNGTNNYGFYLGSMTGATNNYGIYTNSGKNRLGDDLDVVGETTISGISSDGTGKVVCIKSDGYLGTCSDQPNASGVCTCN